MTNVLKRLAEVNPWINDRLALVVRHGSWSYGTNIATSDEDFKGICVAKKECYLGFNNNFEQQELKDPDTCIFEIRKFFKLAAACNPNCLEILFVDPSDHVHVSPLGEKLLAERDAFLSKRVRYTFAGYAKSQLNKIELHRRYLLNPPKSKPERADFDLPPKTEIPEQQLLAAKAEIKKELDRYHLGQLDDLREDQSIAIRNQMFDIFAELKITSDDRWMSAARTIGLTDNFIEYMRKERMYDTKKREWDQYHEWEKNRNPKRAADEAKHRIDLKFAYHLIRLLRECKEILETGQVLVKRPDAEELKEIRGGSWSAEKIIEYAKVEDAKLDEICAKSKLRAKPDMVYLDKLCVEIIEKML